MESQWRAFDRGLWRVFGAFWGKSLKFALVRFMVWLVLWYGRDLIVQSSGIVARFQAIKTAGD